MEIVDKIVNSSAVKKGKGFSYRLEWDQASGELRQALEEPDYDALRSMLIEARKLTLRARMHTCQRSSRS